jgi:predicted short-subunit dehydrogenase-like oxidoreductase (DUF2520 family)
MAQALGRALHLRGASIVALAARNRVRGEQAAAFIGGGTRAVTYAELGPLASHLLVAVSDEAIPTVAADLLAAGVRRGIVLHTSGARGPEALAPLRSAGVACGVLHPLQTVPSPELGVAGLQKITFGVGGDQPAVVWAEQLAGVLDGRALRISEDAFPAYHAAATLVSNAIPALVDSAIDLMKSAGVEPFTALDALAPLCRTSADNVAAVGPLDALTGPIARGDAATVGAHLQALARSGRPEIAALYVAVGRCLLDIARRRGLEATKAVAVEHALAGAGLSRLDDDDEAMASFAPGSRARSKETA